MPLPSSPHASKRKNTTTVMGNGPVYRLCGCRHFWWLPAPIRRKPWWRRVLITWS